KNGKVIKFAGIADDITERKKYESEIRESEEKFRKAFVTSPDAININRLHDGLYVSVNEGFTRLTGYTAEDTIGKTSADINIWYDLNDRKRLVDGLKKENQVSNLEARFVTKSGTVIYGLMSATLIDLQGVPHIISISREINDRVQQEQLMKDHILTLTLPSDDASDVSFTTLFNLENIQKIQDTFADAFEVASIITKPDGTPLTRPSNFCKLCKDIIRQTETGMKNCMHSDAVIGRQNTGGPVIMPCLSGGLTDAGASITVGGKHIANWLIGQVRSEETVSIR
ncbi:MAG: PAS domain S-box protein, partial [Bacteroidales bacterium]|nr:PAS domain S-box protein [Bacteroidales bacterium]